jgi:hypothetical protein
MCAVFPMHDTSFPHFVAFDARPFLSVEKQDELVLTLDQVRVLGMEPDIPSLSRSSMHRPLPNGQHTLPGVLMRGD